MRIKTFMKTINDTSKKYVSTNEFPGALEECAQVLAMTSASAVLEFCRSLANENDKTEVKMEWIRQFTAYLELE